MKNKILQFIEYVLASFDNHNKGASGKKLTAFAVTVAYCYAHRFLDVEHLAEVLLVDGGLITALFGVNVVQVLKEKTNEGNNNQ